VQRKRRPLMGSIKLDMSAPKAVTALLAYLLDSGKVSAVLTPRRDRDTGAYDIGLVADQAGLADATPLAPVMVANTGQVLSSLTPAGKPLAVVLKPCELRAFVERVKREQGALDNLLTISYTCGGVFPLEKVIEDTFTDTIPAYLKRVASGEVIDGVRETCTACEHFVPMTADVTVSIAGDAASTAACRIYLNTERARELVQGLEGEHSEDEFDPAMTAKILARRTAEKQRLFASISPAGDGLDGLIEIFGKCVGCHGCGRVCPICYCLLCDFESRSFDYDLPYFEKELAGKRALRLPPDTIFFHLGRMTHMSFSCVGCGLCSDTCPVGIPVATVFKKVGEHTSSLFDYVPGRDVEEAIPVMVFKEEEFNELG
jgi:formate dehydrogenase subunit beta